VEAEAGLAVKLPLRKIVKLGGGKRSAAGRAPPSKVWPIGSPVYCAGRNCHRVERLLRWISFGPEPTFAHEMGRGRIGLPHHRAAPARGPGKTEVHHGGRGPRAQRGRPHPNPEALEDTANWTPPPRRRQTGR